MENKKNNTSFVVLICLIAAVAVCCGFLIFKQLNKNTTPKNMFINGIENLFKTEKNEKKFETISTDFKLSIDAKSVSLEQEILDLFNKISLEGTANVDIKNNIGLIGLTALYDKSSLFDGKLYIEENAVYMYLTDLFDKWIKLDAGDLTQNDLSGVITMNGVEVDPQELEVLSEEVKDAFIKSLKDNYFTKEKDDNLTIVTLTIDKDNVLDIINSFITNLDNSKNFKETAKKITGTDVDYILDTLTESLKDVSKNDLNEMSPIKIKMSLNNKNEIKKLSVDTTIEEQKILIEAEMVDENNSSLSVYISGIKLISLSVKDEKKGDTTNSTIGLSVTGLIDLNINLETTVKYDEKLEKIDTSNSIDVNSLTEKQIESIENKFMNNKAVQKLISAIEELIPEDEMVIE